MNKRSELAQLLKKKYTNKVYIDIFNILNEEKYSSNSNGIFFNLKEIPDIKIDNCIHYIQSLSHNIQDHIKNLSIREDLQEEYKNSIDISKKKETKSYIPELKTKYQKGESKEIVSPFVKKVYKSKVFKRLDNIMLGKKKEEKNQKKIVITEKLEDSIDENDEDLFGDEDSDDIFVSKDEYVQDLEPGYDSE